MYGTPVTFLMMQKKEKKKTRQLSSLNMPPVSITSMMRVSQHCPETYFDDVDDKNHQYLPKVGMLLREFGNVIMYFALPGCWDHEICEVLPCW